MTAEKRDVIKKKMMKTDGDLKLRWPTFTEVCYGFWLFAAAFGVGYLIF